MTALKETKEQKFYRILHRFWGNDYTYKAALFDLNLPRFAETVALKLWKEQVPEDGDTKELRRQLIHLNKVGRWDFED